MSQAITDIELFYCEYNRNKTEKIQENRTNNEKKNAMNDQLLATIQESDVNFWDTVRKTADKIKRPKSTATKDTSRMRQIMQSFISEVGNS